MINAITKTLKLYAPLIISAGLLLSAAHMDDLPPPYVEIAPPAYAPPIIVPMPPPAVQPIVLPIAPQAPPVINNVINVINNISQLNMGLVSLNRHYSQRYWLSFTMTQLQPLTRLTINYCDRCYLYSWDIDFSKKKKKHKKIKVHQLGGYYLLKNGITPDLLDINIYSICLL